MDAVAKARYATEDRIGVLEELLNERYSVRAFLPQEVPRETIEQILKVAQRTASWCNSQPWQVLIASGEAKEGFRKAIYAEAASGAKDDHDFTPPREYLGVYLERRRESGFQLYNTLGIVRGDKMAYAKQALENYNFFGAPHVAIIHTDEPLGIYGAVDCGAYVSNFMLAAQALGLGTIPQAALARHSGLIRRHFKLADDRKRGLRHLFRVRRPRPQGQQLPHLAGERCRYRDVHRLDHQTKNAPTVERQASIQRYGFNSTGRPFIGVQQRWPFDSRHWPLPGWLFGSDAFCACAMELAAIEPTARMARTKAVIRNIQLPPVSKKHQNGANEIRRWMPGQARGFPVQV